MSNYIFLMQLYNDSSLDPADGTRLITLSEVGSGLSMVGCVIILSLLCFLPTTGDGLFIIGNMCVVIMGAQLSFLGAENSSYPSPVMCKAATFLIQYFFLCIHFSSLTYGIHLWSKLKPQAVMEISRKRTACACIIWIVPLVVVIITALARGNIYAQGSLCWLPEEYGTRLAFIIPMSCILILNSVLYFLIIGTRVYMDFVKAQSRNTIARHVVVTSLSLLPALSLCWVFGFSVTTDSCLAVQYLYVCLNSAQGFFLLFFHVLPNGQIKNALCSRARDTDTTKDSTSRPTGPFTVYSE